jgi:hypothetical protein
VQSGGDEAVSPCNADDKAAQKRRRHIVRVSLDSGDEVELFRLRQRRPFKGIRPHDPRNDRGRASAKATGPWNARHEFEVECGHVSPHLAIRRDGSTVRKQRLVVRQQRPIDPSDTHTGSKTAGATRESYVLSQVKGDREGIKPRPKVR